MNKKITTLLMFFTMLFGWQLTSQQLVSTNETAAFHTPQNETQWLQAANGLKESSRRRLEKFLHELCQTLSSLLSQKDKSKKIKIEAALEKAITHTKNQFTKIASFLKLLEEVQSTEKVKFNIPTILETAAPNQGENKLNLSNALQGILIQDADLLKVIDLADNAFKKINIKKVTERLHEEEIVFTLIEQAYNSVKNDSEDDSSRLYCNLLDKLKSMETDEKSALASSESLSEETE